MNNDVRLWRDILDKTKELIVTSRCCEVSREDKGPILAELEDMDRMLDSDKHFSLAFSGMTNVGKSTLLNALLGDSVAPTKNCPWSSTAVEYRYSPDGYEIIVPLPNFKSLHRRFDTSEDLLNELCQFAVQGCAYQTDNPLVVRLPNELLAGDIAIVDTPGFGAADGSTDVTLHDDVLLSYIKRRERDLRIFWIVKDNIGESSVTFFREHLADFCSDLIVNLTDDYDEDFTRQFEKLYKPAVGHTVRFHYVNAKAAVKAAKKQDMELQRKSGIDDLKLYLSSFSSAANRINLVKNDLGVLFQGIGDFLYVANHFSCDWQPTAWGTLSALLQTSGAEGLREKFLTLKEFK